MTNAGDLEQMKKYILTTVFIKKNTSTLVVEAGDTLFKLRDEMFQGPHNDKTVTKLEKP